jgi:biotin carboxyl carrier protein
MKDDIIPEYLNIDSGRYLTRISKKYRSRKPYKPADPKQILSFIPGTITDILVVPGQEIRKGDDLIVLNAMKMQNKIKSPECCIIKSILVNIGDKVAKGSVLIVVE